MGYGVGAPLGPIVGRCVGLSEGGGGVGFSVGPAVVGEKVGRSEGIVYTKMLGFVGELVSRGKLSSIHIDTQVVRCILRHITVGVVLGLRLGVAEGEAVVGDVVGPAEGIV